MIWFAQGLFDGHTSPVPRSIAMLEISSCSLLEFVANVAAVNEKLCIIPRAMLIFLIGILFLKCQAYSSRQEAVLGLLAFWASMISVEQQTLLFLVQITHKSLFTVDLQLPLYWNLGVLSCAVCLITLTSRSPFAISFECE